MSCMKEEFNSFKISIQGFLDEKHAKYTFLTLKVSHYTSYVGSCIKSKGTFLDFFSILQCLMRNAILKSNNQN